METIFFKDDIGCLHRQFRQFTNCVDIISRLKELYKNNPKIKIWCSADSGLGDCFSHLNAVLFICCTCCNIPIENITFSPKLYTNLSKYILSERIKILNYEECLQIEFDVHIPIHMWSVFQIHLSHENHFSKFFTYSKSILEQTSIYSDVVCVYLRFYTAETEGRSSEIMIKQYMKSFLNFWNSSEQYIICSPHPIIEVQTWPSNVILSTQINNRKCSSPQYNFDQRNNTEIVIQDMAILSNSKRVIVFLADASQFFATAMYMSTCNKPTLNNHSTEENIQGFKTNKFINKPLSWKNVSFKRLAGI
jgi:hypothetical protein